MAGLRGGGDEHVFPDQVLNTKTGQIQTITSDRYNSFESGVELGWQVALFSVRPRAEDDGGVAVGTRAARP